MENKECLVESLQSIKEASGKTCSDIAAETGLTNVYVAQLFRRQAQLKPNTVESLRKAVPSLKDQHIAAMMRPPMRSYNPNILQEPCIYRLHEAVMHFGESIKEVINEDFGDGMSKFAHYAPTIVVFTEPLKVNIKLLVDSPIQPLAKKGIIAGIRFWVTLSDGKESASPLHPISLAIWLRMSAIDFYCSVDKAKGIDGKDRVVLTFDGKYLPHVEQKSEESAAKLLNDEK